MYNIVRTEYYFNSLIIKIELFYNMKLPVITKTKSTIMKPSLFPLVLIMLISPILLPTCSANLINDEREQD